MSYSSECELCSTMVMKQHDDHKEMMRLDMRSVTSTVIKGDHTFAPARTLRVDGQNPLPLCTRSCLGKTWWRLSPLLRTNPSPKRSQSSKGSETGSESLAATRKPKYGIRTCAAMKLEPAGYIRTRDYCQA